MTDELPSVPPQLLIGVVTTALDAPVVFADGLYHLSTINGVARLSFVQNLADPLGTPAGEKGFQGKHVVTVAMPMSQLIPMRDYLIDTIANFAAQGLMPPEVK